MLNVSKLRYIAYLLFHYSNEGVQVESQSHDIADQWHQKEGYTNYDGHHTFTNQSKEPDPFTNELITMLDRAQ